MSVDELKVSPRIIAELNKAKLTDYGKILTLSIPDLGKLTQLSITEIKTLQLATADAIPKTPIVTALDLLQGTVPDKLKITNLSTGCSVLDGFLRGGILSQGITEIAGESASGKTQICMQLCLSAQLPERLGGLNSGALYICTEDVFPNKRLVQMAAIFKRSRPDPEVQKIKFCDNIFIEHTAELSDLEYCLNRKAPILLARGAARLIIVDSIAALFRCEFGAQEAVKRTKILSGLTSQLLKLSHTHNVPIICVNQVTDAFDNGTSFSGGDRAKRKHVPTLGLAWSNMVTVRLLLSRTQQHIDLANMEERSKFLTYSALLRHMDVLFAPHLPNNTCGYIIDTEGVKGVG